MRHNNQKIMTFHVVIMPDYQIAQICSINHANLIQIYVI
jgi:hypothetical protein